MVKCLILIMTISLTFFEDIIKSSFPSIKDYDRISVSHVTLKCCMIFFLITHSFINRSKDRFYMFYIQEYSLPFHILYWFYKYKCCFQISPYEFQKTTSILFHIMIWYISHDKDKFSNSSVIGTNGASQLEFSVSINVDKHVSNVSSGSHMSQLMHHEWKSSIRPGARNSNTSSYIQVLHHSCIHANVHMLLFKER